MELRSFFATGYKTAEGAEVSNAGVREAITSAGASVLYLPPYSPDLNPIETVFSKFKWLIRSLKERTVEALWTACGTVSQLFPEDECRRHFRHCGYRYG